MGVLLLLVGLEDERANLLPGAETLQPLFYIEKQLTYCSLNTGCLTLPLCRKVTYRRERRGRRVN